MAIPYISCILYHIMIKPTANINRKAVQCTDMCFGGQEHQLQWQINALIYLTDILSDSQYVLIACTIAAAYPAAQFYRGCFSFFHRD